MFKPEEVTDAMVDQAFGDLLDGTGNANWAGRPNREIMRSALARAITEWQKGAAPALDVEKIKFAEEVLRDAARYQAFHGDRLKAAATAAYLESLIGRKP